MARQDDDVRTLVAALKGDAGARGDLTEVVADDVMMIGLRGRSLGRDAVLERLADPAVSAMVAQATWSDPTAHGDTATVRATLPTAAQIGGFDYRVHFDAAGRIDRVEQHLLPPAPLEPAPLVLDDDICDLLAGALANRTPTVVAYVDADGRPHVSLRATTQVFTPDHIAMWIRDPQGGLLRGIETNPNVTIWYRDAEQRINLQFYGRAHRDDSDATRNAVYDNSPEAERNLDPSRRGVAVVVDVDRVEGARPEGRVLMTRST